MWKTSTISALLQTAPVQEKQLKARNPMLPQTFSKNMFFSKVREGNKYPIPISITITQLQLFTIIEEMFIVVMISQTTAQALTSLSQSDLSITLSTMLSNIQHLSIIKDKLQQECVAVVGNPEIY